MRPIVRISKRGADCNVVKVLVNCTRDDSLYPNSGYDASVLLYLYTTRANKLVQAHFHPRRVVVVVPVGGCVVVAKEP